MVSDPFATLKLIYKQGCGPSMNYSKLLNTTLNYGGVYVKAQTNYCNTDYCNYKISGASNTLTTNKLMLLCGLFMLFVN